LSLEQYRVNQNRGDSNEANNKGISVNLSKENEKELKKIIDEVLGLV
jgi:hypothetical protein